MNRLVSEPLSAESVILAALPILEAVGALLAIIAILTLVIAILHIILEARSSDLHAQSCLFNTVSGRIRPFPVDAGGGCALEHYAPHLEAAKRPDECYFALEDELSENPDCGACQGG